MPVTPNASLKENWLRAGIRLLAIVATGFILLVMRLWVAFALHFDVRVPCLCVPLAAIWLLAILLVWIRAKGLWLKMGLTAGAAALVTAWWFDLKPSNVRDARTLVNGYGDELLYERRLINISLPLVDSKQRVHINTKARAADKNADFSRLMRQGLPDTSP